jgi:hypothetical protein
VRPGRAADPSPPFKRQGRGIVELYLYPTPGHNRACHGVTLPFLSKLHWRSFKLTVLSIKVFR